MPWAAVGRLGWRRATAPIESILPRSYPERRDVHPGRALPEVVVPLCQAGHDLTMSTGAISGKIVVGVDGSAPSVEALRWAVREARRRCTSLSVVVAYRHDPTLQPPLGSDAPQGAADVLRRALLAAGLAEELVETRIVDGSPAPSLVAAARDADLIVLGHQAHGSMSRTLLGTVNTDRDKHFTCPVVVVPPGCS